MRVHHSATRVALTSGLITMLFAGALALAFGAEAAPLRRAVRLKASAHCARGFGHLERDVLDQASAEFEEALHAAPGYPPAHVGLGHVAMRRGDFEGALREYQLARDAALRAAVARDAEALRLGIAARRRADAIHELVSSVTQSGLDRSETMNSLYAEADSQFADDMKKLEHGGEANLRESAQLFFFMGGPQFRLQRYHDALDSWTTSARLDPKFGPVYSNLAVVCFKLGRLLESQAYVAKAEALKVPVNEQFKLELAQELERQRSGAGPL